MQIFWIVGTLALLSFAGVAPVGAVDGTVQVTGVVAGPPPSSPPSINEPAQGVTVTAKSIAVKGDCITDLVVKVFRSGNFAGSALCQSDGRFSLQIDLLEGRNDLIARQYDVLNQPSPDSDTVSVFYVPAQPVLPGDQPSVPQTIAQFQLVLSYDQTVQTVFVDQPFNLPIRFSGGSGPYAVAIDWGDGETDLFSRPTTDQFVAKHINKKQGYKIITVRVSDATGKQAQVQFVVLVQGAPRFDIAKASELLQTVPGAVILLGVAFSLAIGFIAGVVFNTKIRAWLTKRLTK